MTQLHVLSGGAAFGLVSQLEARFKADTGCAVAGTFNAVGAMRDQLLAGTACDVLILTQGLIDQLTTSGHVVAGSARSLGRVKTGIAVKQGVTPPAVATAEELKATLLAAKGIYFPDPVKATAGIHFMSVLKQLGIDVAVQNRLRPFANGATAMAALADCGESDLIGCTQVTEIIITPGIHLVAPLPKVFELATVYTAAVSSQATQAQAAAALIALLAGDDAAPLRKICGFED